MNELSKQQCVPCRGVAALNGADLVALHRQLDAEWTVVSEHHLEKEYRFEDFRRALDFTNKVGEMAEQQNHHPDIFLDWGHVRSRSGHTRSTD